MDCINNGIVHNAKKCSNKKRQKSQEIDVRKRIIKDRSNRIQDIFADKYKIK